MERPNSINRRHALIWTGTSAMALGGIAGGSVLLSRDAGATAAVEIDAPNLEVSSPDGTVEEIIINVEANATYSGFNDVDVEYLGFTLTLNGKTIHEGNYSIEHPDIGGVSGPDKGNVHYRPYPTRIGPDDDQVFLFEDTAFEPPDFEVPEDGASKTFDLDLGLEFRVMSPKKKVLMKRHTSATATITLHNEEDTDDGSEYAAGLEATTVEIQVELPNGETVGSA